MGMTEVGNIVTLENGKEYLKDIIAEKLLNGDYDGIDIDDDDNV